MAVKVQDSHDYHFVDVKPSFALPNALQGKFPSPGRKPAEPLDKPLFDGTEFPLGNRFPGVAGQRQKNVILSGASRHAYFRRYDSWSR